jgi:streptomycin 3"-adenylyltransferase
MVNAGSLPEDLALDETDREQVAEVLKALRDVLGAELVGAYLHGSAVLGGLRAQSDIDVLAVSARRMTHEEKERLVAGLMSVSGPYPVALRPRPIELSIVVGSEIRPWVYPPRMEFQYGEWWRERFVRGELEPWASRDPDLAIILTMVLLADATLLGPPPSEVFDPVPPADLIDAFTEGIPGMLSDVHSDTRNLVLTLSRIWCSVVTKEIHPKDAAAGWALPRLPPEHRAVLARARSIYLGTEDEHWEDLRDRIRLFADAMVEEIEAARSADPASEGGSAP